MTTVDAASRVNPDWLQSPTNFFTIGPGDRLEIELLGDPTSRTTALVGPDGKVYFHLLPGVDVWGATLTQAREKLEHEMLNFVRDNPKVSLGLRSVESRCVWLLGRVNTPGVYPLAGPTTLLEAIAMAGGPASAGVTLASISSTAGLGGLTAGTADLRRSFIMRQGRLLPVDFQRLLKQGDMTQNIYLEPDDFVYLPSAAVQNVYVLGAVTQPKAVAFTRQLTLVAALAGAGGTIKDAYLSHVAIVRGSLTEPRIAVVDFRDVILGRVPNVVLDAQDIVYVPFTPYRTLTRYVDLILQTFVRTVGANEGSRAIIPGSTPIGPNVPIGQ